MSGAVHHETANHKITTPSSVLYANQCGGHSRDFWTWLRASGSRNLFTIRSFNTSWEAVGWVLRVRAGLLLVTLLASEPSSVLQTVE